MNIAGLSSTVSFDFSRLTDQLTNNPPSQEAQPEATTERPPDDDPERWLRDLFPAYVSDRRGTPIPLARHHGDFWSWVWAIGPGERPRPFVAVWPRGGGKSTGAELACVAVGYRRTRRYVLYVSSTQQQADDHVANIAGLLEADRLAAVDARLAERSLGKYGNSRGWRRNRLRTAAGFTVDALGLDTAARGVKLDEMRPDLIVLDDIDDTTDSLLTTQKKIDAITKKLLPAGSTDAATLAVQNLVSYEGVFARLANLASEPGDFLADRIISGPHPALVGADFQKQPDGRWKIVAGTATWEGQSVDVCEQQINDWGIRAFRAEAQHERTPPEGQAFPEFDRSVHVCEPFPIPEAWPKLRGVDYGYAVPYGCLWLARSPAGRPYVYRETYGSRKTALEQAYEVRLASAGEQYRFSVGDPAMWATQREGKTYQSVADQYGEMGVALAPADNDRLAGKARVHEVLAHGEGVPPTLQIFSSCHNLIRTLPMLPTDPHKPEDVDTLAEDHCLAGGTMVETEHGPRRIADLVGKTGQLYTHDGRLIPFFDVRMTQVNAEVIQVTMRDGRSVICTPDHRMLTAEGSWVEAGSLTPGRMMQSVIIPSWTRSASPRRSRSSWASDFIFAGSTFSTWDDGSMSLSGRQRMDPSPRDITSIISTMTERTTASATFKQNPGFVTSATIPRTRVIDSGQRGERMSNTHLRGISGSRMSSAVTPHNALGWGEHSPQFNAGFAENPLTRPSQDERSSVEERAGRQICVVGDVRPAGVENVYDLAVWDTSHALAVNGGLIVHNCYDILRYLLMALPWTESTRRQKPRAMHVGARR